MPCPCMEGEPQFVDLMQQTAEDLARRIREFGKATGMCPVALRQFLLMVSVDALPPDQVEQLGKLLLTTASVKGTS